MTRIRNAFLSGMCLSIGIFGLLGAAVGQEAREQSSVRSQISRPPGTATQRTTSGRAARTEPKRYFVEFRSRNAESYGHTFAVHGLIGQKIAADHVVGLHPATDSPIPWMIGHILLVPSETGASDGDTEDEYITARFRVLLTEAEYKKTVSYMKGLQERSPVWHAVLYNCNAFVADIAQSMGLRTPFSTLMMPKEFITELGHLNTGRHAATATTIE